MIDRKLRAAETEACTAKIRERKEKGKKAEHFTGGPRLHCVLRIFQCVVSKSFLVECSRLLSVQVPADEDSKRL